MGMKCIQFMLFVVNFMFVIVGTLLLTLASTILLAYSDLETFIEIHYFQPAQILVAVGVIIILVSFFGCIAAIKQSTLLVNVYALFLLLLLILEISAAITTFIASDAIYNIIDENMNKTMMDYTHSHHAKIAWDFTQDRLHCCGIHSALNWAPLNVDGPEITDLHNNLYTVPHSCCKDWRCEEVHYFGCLNVVTDYVVGIGLILIYITITVEFAQCLGLIFACMLSKTIRRVKTQEEMERQQFRHTFYNQLISGRRQEQNSNLSSSDA
ncbi:hypothetical protein ILUMI_07122 [Ignelater luminosus]|uniref:Tetraspanin n=1 Tax=Ignelater luminosus TaxID=2038154 RepID=A0A8K0GGL5_IGNLU|nr:hypothetical protein ILUMI_07122 [Ignelater luminosus]